MQKANKPKCFVAMAFDHDDTDKLYDLSIRPVLQKLSVTPIIINRREDNRDINNQIIEQLDECDFCITDLTYARPSVYFEAGYAQQRIEVIYTVRADHLKPNQPDDLRVHFDLQMKPLIKWSKSDDVTFRSKLKKRLLHTALKAWNLKNSLDEKLQLQRSKFANLSLNEQIISIRIKELQYFAFHGFKSWSRFHQWPFSIEDPISVQKAVATAKSDNWMLSAQPGNSHLKVITLRTEEKLTAKILKEVYEWLISPNYTPFWLDHQHFTNLASVSKTTEFHILTALRPVPNNRIISSMPLLKRDIQTGHFIIEVKSEKNWRPISIMRSINLYVLGDVKSISELTETLRLHFSSLSP